LGFIHHEFHHRVAAWVQAQGFPQLATCPITELGFTRVLSQASAYGFTIVQARASLLRLKKSDVLPFTFIADSHDIWHLPAWVKTPKQITDGHLVQLASSNGAILATLDKKIPGSYLIP
jgi:uncharacterized protein